MSSLFVIITGASKGIGRSCAIECMKRSSDIKKLHLCLLARNVDGLAETSRLAIASKDNTESNIEISTHEIDLSDLESLQEKIQLILPSQSTEAETHYDHCILINNAGSLGHLGQAKDLPSPMDLQTNIDFNLASSCWLSSYFVRWFHNMNTNANNANDANDDSSIANYKKCTVVNMSSLCAVTPFPTMAAYCAGKAYRDMYHTTMSIEEKNNNNIKILNYAPGAVATDMTTSLSECEVLDADLSDFFKERDETKFVKVEDTSRKLIDLVLAGNFESGKHVDYWDDI